MHQTDRWPDSHAGLSSTPHPVPIGIDAGAAPAHARWLDKISHSVASAQESHKQGPTGAAQIFERGDLAHSLPSLIHDARNMVSAMDLYCDLLSEPGVLSPSFAHYAGELRLVSNAGRRLLEELAVAESLNGLETDLPLCRSASGGQRCIPMPQRHQRPM